MYACGLQITHVCALVVIPLSQYGVVWVVCVRGVVVGLSRRVPSFASWLAIWLHVMSVCALTFGIVILCVNHVIWLTMAAMTILSGWLCWDDRCRMWLFIKYILLRLFVKMRVSHVWCCVLFTIISMTFH